MPIEIKELHIKINVDNNRGSMQQNDPDESQESIVAQCVEQVMQILKNQKER